MFCYFVTNFFLFVPHSVSICNDCIPVRGQISAAPPQGLSQRGIHASLQIGNHAASGIDVQHAETSPGPQLEFSSVVALNGCLSSSFAGVAKFRGRSSANGGGGFAATRSEKQHVANVGQPGNWRSASTGEFGVLSRQKAFTISFIDPQL